MLVMNSLDRFFIAPHATRQPRIDSRDGGRAHARSF
ncbi:MAG: hypothetical protein RIQ56_54, partial [Candidatus Parcubacteria bacterium]